MNELQLSFLLEVAVNFLVICSISTLAFGRGRLWVVGHAALLGSGGVFALVSRELPLAIAVLATIILVACWAAALSAAAAGLEGDRFVVVSLASAYGAYAFFIATLGEGVRDLPGAHTVMGRALVLGGAMAVCAVLALYTWGLSQSGLNSILVLGRDQPLVLKAAGLPSRPLVFWLHLVSTAPVGIAGLAAVAFHCTYSPAAHALPRCLILFALAFPFGVNSLGGSIAAAVLLGVLGRVVDLALASELVNRAYAAIVRWGGVAGAGATASNLAAPMTEALLALLFIVLLRARPQGVWGTESRWARK